MGDHSLSVVININPPNYQRYSKNENKEKREISLKNRLRLQKTLGNSQFLFLALN